MKMEEAWPTHARNAFPNGLDDIRLIHKVRVRMLAINLISDDIALHAVPGYLGKLQGTAMAWDGSVWGICWGRADRP